MGKKAVRYHNARLITGKPVHPLIQGGSLLVEDGKLLYVGPDYGCERWDAQAIDLHGAIVMPGLITAHCHFYGQFARGMPLRTQMHNWQQVLSHMWWTMDKALDREQVYYCAMMGLAEGLKAGVTTYFDHHASPNCIEGSLDEIERAVYDAGGRACLAYEVSDRDGTDRAALGIEENVRFIRKHMGTPEDRVRGMFGLHASYTLGDATLERCSTEGNRLGAGFHTHMAEDRADVADGYRRWDMHVAERFFAHHILGPKSITAHNVHLGPQEYALLLKTQTTAAYNCQSNTNNAVGISPVRAMLEAGIQVALGGDSYSSDLFSELSFAAMQQRLAAGNPSAFPPQMVWEMAFTNAQALAKQVFGYHLGVLEPGAAADFLILDYDPPTPLLEENLLSHMLGGFSGHIHTVVVAGEKVVENHRCTKFDQRELNARCREHAARLWAKL